MQTSSLNQSSFGQLILKRENGLKQLTPRQTNAVFYLSEITDNYKSSLIHDLETGKYTDIIVKARKNGNIDIFTRRETAPIKEDGTPYSFIPYDAKGIGRLKTTLNLNNGKMADVKNEIDKFLGRCDSYAVRPLALHNREIEEAIESKFI